MTTSAERVADEVIPPDLQVTLTFQVPDGDDGKIIHRHPTRPLALAVAAGRVSRLRLTRTTAEHFADGAVRARTLMIWWPADAEASDNGNTTVRG